MFFRLNVFLLLNLALPLRLLHVHGVWPSHGYYPWDKYFKGKGKEGEGCGKTRKMAGPPYQDLANGDSGAGNNSN